MLIFFEYFIFLINFKIHVFRLDILYIFIKLHMQMITVGNRWYYELSIGVSYSCMCSNSFYMLRYSGTTPGNAYVVSTIGRVPTYTVWIIHSYAAYDRPSRKQNTRAVTSRIENVV